MPSETEVPEGKSCTPSTDQLMKHFSEKDDDLYFLTVNFVSEIYGEDGLYDMITPEAVKEVFDSGELSVSVIAVYIR
jgi:hypothetical protein